VTTPSTNTTYTAAYTAASGGTGTGLSATYYNNSNFTGTSFARVDPAVNFFWGAGAPAPSIGADTFSVRWTGQVQPQFTQTYTFYTQSDDGVRLWVNGRRLVNNWTNHSSTENSGTIALTAGVRYDIRLDFFENAGWAEARLSWSSASTPKAVVPATSLYPQAGASAVRINFQPAGAAIPTGYLADTGLVYGARGNGQTYGWNADNGAQTRDRNASNSPDQRYDTLTHLQKPANPDAVWEIAVANGRYTVRVISGDPVSNDGVFRTTVEGVLAVNGTPTTSARWVAGTVTITVADGRLTIRSGSGATNNKICFVEITPAF
jgi:hypothetical protein